MAARSFWRIRRRIHLLRTCFPAPDAGRGCTGRMNAVLLFGHLAGSPSWPYRPGTPDL